MPERPAAWKKRPAAEKVAGTCLWCAALAGAFALYLSSLSFPFASDDYVHLKWLSSFSWRSVPALLATPGGDGFFRPAGYVFLAAVAELAGSDPVRFHLASLLLHAANCFLLGRLALRLGWRPEAAAFSATAFAIHGAHPEAVVWMAGIFDLTATLWVLLALLASLAYDETRLLQHRVTALVAGLLALLSKELAFVLPVLLFLCLWHSQKRQAREALRAAAPLLFLTVLVFGYRYYLLGGVGGYLDPRTGQPQALSMTVSGALQVLLFRLWGPLYFPVNWSSPPGIGLALLTVAAALAYLTAAWTEPRQTKFRLALCLTAVAALPALHQLSISESLEKARLLYAPSIGFSLLLGAAFGAVKALPQRCAIAAMVLLFHGEALRHNLSIWENVTRLANEACLDVSRSLTASDRKVTLVGLPASLSGVYFFRNGFPECVEMKSGRSVNVTIAPTDAVLDTENTHPVFRWNGQRQRLERRPPHP